MPVKTPDSKEEQDSAYNPGDIHAAEQFGAYSGAGIDQAEAFANDPKNASSEAKEAEENPVDHNAMNFTGGNGENASGGGFSNFMARFKSGGLKKFGPSAGIAGVLIGGFGFSAVILSPALGLIHMAELFTEDLNDQVAAMDTRAYRVFASKLKPMGKASIKCELKIECGFKGMSDDEIKKFKDAGITVEKGEGPNKFGKYNVASLTVTDKDGRPQTITDVRKLDKLFKKDKVVAQKLRRAQRIKLSGLNDSLHRSFLARIGSSKSDKIDGKDEKEKWENTKKTANTLDETRVLTPKDGVGESAKGVFKNIGKFLNVLGVVDAGCMAQGLVRDVEKATKEIRALSLGNFAMSFLSLTSQIKDGSADPNDVEMFGNILTSVDTNKRAITDNSYTNEDQELQETDNPDYQKSAFDSAGYKTAAYNDAPTLSTRSMKYTVAGAENGILFTVIGKYQIPSTICSILGSWPAQVLGVGLGIAVGVFTGGTGSAAIKGAKVVATGIAGALASVLTMKILEAYLMDIEGGNIITDDTKGVESGDALFSGSAYTLGQTAQFHGMKPSETVEEVRQYQTLASEVKSSYAAIEQEDAQLTPFDIMNQYSFIGSFARTVVPLANSASVSISSAAAAIPKFIGMAMSALTAPKVGAENSGDISKFNPERFTKCNDNQYKGIGIEAADTFCNLRYSLSQETLDLDVDDVIFYMTEAESCTLDEDDELIPMPCVDSNGDPEEDLEYAHWIEECVERKPGWGIGVDPVVREGDACLDPHEYVDGVIDSLEEIKIQYFQAYRMDHSIIEPEGGRGVASGSTNPSDSGGGVVSGDVKALAQQILDLAAQGKIVISDFSSNTTSDSASRSLTSQQLADIAAGKSVGVTTRCGFPIGPITPDANLLKFLAELGQNTKYTINSLFGQCHSQASYHFQGKAVDFGCPLDTTAADLVGAKYGIKQNNETCAANAHWHYSVNGG